MEQSFAKKEKRNRDQAHIIYTHNFSTKFFTKFHLFQSVRSTISFGSYGEFDERMFKSSLIITVVIVQKYIDDSSKQSSREI